MVVTSTKLVLASSQLLIPVLDDFHFHVLAFLQGLSTCFHQNLALPKQKIQITIQTRGVECILGPVGPKNAIFPHRLGKEKAKKNICI